MLLGDIYVERERESFDYSGFRERTTDDFDAHDCEESKYVLHNTLSTYLLDQGSVDVVEAHAELADIRSVPHGGTVGASLSRSLSRERGGFMLYAYVYCIRVRIRRRIRP